MEKFKKKEAINTHSPAIVSFRRSFSAFREKSAGISSSNLYPEILLPGQDGHDQCTVIKRGIFSFQKSMRTTNPKQPKGTRK